MQNQDKIDSRASPKNSDLHKELETGYLHNEIVETGNKYRDREREKEREVCFVRSLFTLITESLCFECASNVSSFASIGYARKFSNFCYDVPRPSAGHGGGEGRLRKSGGRG